MRPILAACLVVFCSTIAAAAPGDLDQTFGSAGRVYTGVPESDECFAYVRSVAEQPDGRVLVGGSLGNLDNERKCPDGRSFYVRYLNDGTVDESFGTGGKVLFPDYASGLSSGIFTVLPDGKILIHFNSRLARLLPGGQIDVSYGGDGFSDPFTVDEPNFLFMTSLTLQTDGKVLVSIDSDHWVDIYRLNADGSRDVSFGTNGSLRKMRSAFYGSWLLPETKLMTGSDGKIFVAGDGAVARFDQNGMPDHTFGPNGRSEFGNSHFWDAVLQPDGKIIVLHDEVFRTLVRFNTNGTIDSTFGTGGIVRLNGIAVDFENVLIARDGKIIVTGRSRAGSGGFAASRFLPNGALDSSFGNTLVADHSMNADTPAVTFFSASALENNGRLLIAGWFGGNPDLQKKIVVAGLTTAPGATVSGRVVAPNGAPLRNAVVVLTDALGNRRTAVTSSFGVFAFSGLTAGQNYTLTVSSKRYRFSPRSITTNDADLTGVDLVGME